MAIKTKDPVREDFAGCSTSNNYYDTKGHAVSAFDDTLARHGYRFDYNDTQSLYGDEGRVNAGIFDDSDNLVARAILTWYRMPSGCYEFIGYIA